MNCNNVLKLYEKTAGENFEKIGFKSSKNIGRLKRDYTLDVGEGFLIFFYPGGYRKFGGVMVEPVFGLDYRPLDDYFLEHVDPDFDPRVGHIFSKGSYERSYDLYFLEQPDQIEPVVNRVIELYEKYIYRELSSIASKEGVLSFLDRWSHGDSGNIVTGNEVYLRDFFLGEKKS